MPGELAARDPADQHLGTGSGRRRRHQITGATGSGEADNRGGQPGRGLLIGGKTREDAVGGIQRGGAGFRPASGQRDRGGDQVRLGSAQAWPCGMPPNSSARDGLPRGSMISPIASPSMTMLAASCQSPAWAACRTASVSWPYRSYHRAARRCSGAIRSGCSRSSFRRSTSANNVW